ncbi:Prolyl oligopeptidase family protein [Klebsormidium nitens]|uniref:Prolyl endopeptidase n=1 Tax=Klebsormidium nitens TaxID=105231 RepID=A0A1Y1HW21_KLENI|nr:Prolyl oligopeptidase family protein [Klebsormidium nitens]|eukprot:GAQ82840.1 Prolyl oligopeptidase family protein [Klebsormidium nitens]
MAETAAATLKYPEVRRDETVVDEFHGKHQIADPYRWLENPDDAETKAFVDAQNEVTQKFLSECETREKFRERMTALYNYPKYGTPFRRGSKYFYFKNTGLQAQSVLYMVESVDAPEESARILLDPNTLSSDGTVALSSYSFSEDGQFLAYGLSKGGSDWQEVHVLRVSDGQEESDVLKWAKFTSLAWTHDNAGLFYNRYPEPPKAEGLDAGTETASNLHQKLYYHRLGTDQAEDILCYEAPDEPKWMFGAEITDDGKYLIISVEEGCDPVNRVFYCDLEALSGGLAGVTGLLPVVKLIDNFEAQYGYIANDGTSFVFQTNKNAPLYKVVRVDLTKPDSWEDLIPESKSDLLEWAHCVHQSLLLVCYQADVKHVLQLHDLASGRLLRGLPLDIGSVSSATGRRQDSQIFYSFTGFLNPSTIFRVDLEQPDAAPTVFRDTVVGGLNKDEFETRQVFVPSKDGTKIPMFVVSKKGIALDGSHPALLYGYGGFNISLTPSFSVARVILMRHYGAVVAIANIRGGGEYGETWHKAGSLANKQNCFDDFQACSEYLINSGYTAPARLAIEGGSNGGLLVAACINQRPDLYGAALAHVGVMDMLRFHLFTIGHAWTTDYGCADKADQFEWLIKYSPLHNVRRPWESPSDGAPAARQYPATLLLTGDHDDRVSPLHSLKLIATLQHTLVNSANGSPQSNPLIIRIDTKAGHGAGRPTQKIIDEYADVYSFMAKVTGAKWTD